MRISQLAERSGVPATTLRFYEGVGLLPAERTPSGYRLFGDEAVERLAFIGAAKHLGLPLEDVGERFAVWENGACAEVKPDLRPRIAARRTEAEHRAAELAAFTAALHRALEHLDALPDRSGRCDPECGFLAAPAAARPVDIVLAPSRDRAATPDIDGRTPSRVPARVVQRVDPARRRGDQPLRCVGWALLVGCRLAGGVRG